MDYSKLVAELRDPAYEALTDAQAAAAIDHVGYKDALYRELREIDGLIRAAAETEAALNAGDGGPFEISTDLIP
jgi:hypothetical protein